MIHTQPPNPSPQRPLSWCNTYIARCSMLDVLGDSKRKLFYLPYTFIPQASAGVGCAAAMGDDSSNRCSYIAAVVVYDTPPHTEKGHIYQIRSYRTADTFFVCCYQQRNADKKPGTSLLSSPSPPAKEIPVHTLRSSNTYFGMLCTTSSTTTGS